MNRKRIVMWKDLGCMLLDQTRSAVCLLWTWHGTVRNCPSASQDCAEDDADAFRSLNEEQSLTCVEKGSVRSKTADSPLRQTAAVQHYGRQLQFSTRADSCSSALGQTATVQHYGRQLQFSTTADSCSSALRQTAAVQHYGRQLQFSTKADSCSSALGQILPKGV